MKFSYLQFIFVLITCIAYGFGSGCKNKKADSVNQEIKSANQKIKELSLLNISDNSILEVIKSRDADFIVPVNYYKPDAGLYAIWLLNDKKIIRIHLKNNQGNYEFLNAEITDKNFIFFPSTPPI